MFERLKRRWNITSNFQVIVILTVFAITGSSTVYIKKIIFDLIGITSDMLPWIKITADIVVVLMVYNILLLIVGFLFGQFKFFWNFEKKFFSRFMFWRRQKAVS